MASAKETSPKLRDSSNDDDTERRGSVANADKGKWERLWPVIACGAGLFSDGYLNNVRESQSNKFQRDQPQATLHLQRNYPTHATSCWY
jgi:hypothetical protein